MEEVEGLVAYAVRGLRHRWCGTAGERAEAEFEERVIPEVGPDRRA